MQRPFLFFVLLLVSICALAVPARPGYRYVTLPDGSVRQVVVRGDERNHWLQTPDGQIVGQRVVAHSLIEREQSMLAHRRYNAPKIGSNQSLLLEGSFPTTGKRRLLALLINFANTTPTFPREHFDAMLNEEGYNGVGSFRDYFMSQSRGQLDIHTTVTPWITVGHPKQYYNIDNTPSLISEALSQIDPSIDLRDYDNDGDGILDGLIVIHAGEGQEASGNATDIWSHSSTIYGMQYDGVSLYRYTIEPELLHTSSSTIGVFCHEFGHNLGALDYYDTNYSSDGAYGGTGPWDIMGEGAWNGSGGLGTHPAPFSAWQRWQFGWTRPTLLDHSQQVTMPAFADADTGASDIYIMPTTTEGDYFVLENIQHVTPWSIDIPGHGLIVTHVIESIVRKRMAMNNINASYPQGIYTVCADAHSDPLAGQPSSYGDLTSSATPFPGTRNHTDFTDETLPSTHSQDGRYGYVALQHITEQSDGTLTFDFIQGDAPQRPLNLSATVTQGTVRLTWNFPEEHQLPQRCTIYRDGSPIANVSASDAFSSSTGSFAFTDSSCAASGLISYAVDATYSNGLTSALSSVSTRVPPQLAKDFEGQYNAETGFFEFAWNLPAELTRCTNDLHYELVDHNATNFRYAHRFRADDLQPFVGHDIRSITFLPQQRSTDATYTICVWRMPASSGEPVPSNIPANSLELVAQRKVSEFSPSYLRTVPFVTRPKIEEGYDYFIGVEIQSNGLAEVVTDQAELQQGFGNMMSLNGGVWQPDPLAQGNYILSATLAGEKPFESSLQLIVGAESSAATLFDTFMCPFAPDADLFFPLGFTLYADGQRVAETVNTTLRLPLSAVPIANTSATTFQLVSAYKHGNESRPLTLSLDYSLPDLIPTPAIISSDSPVVRDLSGRIVSSPQQGIYIVCGRKVVK